MGRATLTFTGEPEYMGVASFDMDGVLVRGNSNMLVARERGMEDLARDLEARRAAGEISTAQYNEGIAPVFEGLGHSDIRGFWEMLPKIGGIGDTVAVLAADRIVPVVSTSGLGDFAEQFAVNYGFAAHLGAGLEYGPDGRATGKRTSCVEPQDKVPFARQICIAKGVPYSDLVVVEDSISGLPLLEWAQGNGGTGIAFNYDPSLDGKAGHYVKSGDIGDILHIVMRALRVQERRTALELR